MKLLTFQARSFGWQPHVKTLAQGDDKPEGGRVEDAVVVWLHVEGSDMDDQSRVFRHTLKHIKWIANKKQLRTVVLHFFAHLGGAHAEPDFARALIERIGERLTETGYTVHLTPFGYFCAWELDVYGDSLAKVFKSI